MRVREGFVTSRVKTPVIGVRDLLENPAPLLLLPAALALWFISLDGVDLLAMTDLGLISVLPPAFFASIVVTTVSFALTLHKRQSAWLLILHIGVLIFMLFGVAPILEGRPRTAIAWKMVGIIDYVARHGAVDPTLDAFHNWPGFFILVAFLTRALGLESAMPLALWAPVFFNLLYLAPLYLLFSSATSAYRVRWLGLWFFYLANWIGQDYLAPQALGYFLYIFSLAVLMRWFRAPHASGSIADRSQDGLIDEARGPLSATPRQRLILIAIVILAFAVLVPSHQLSPVAVAASTIVLVVAGRITPRSLPVLMVVLIGVWLSYMAVPYLSGHLAGLVEPLGNLGTNLQDNVVRRLRGSEEHIFVVRLRIGLSLMLWGLALLGFLRRQFNRYRDVDFALLALAPVGLLALQTYGGELALRVYFFSLPFIAFFVASLFYPTLRHGQRLLGPLSAILLSMILIGAFFVARYGNERMDYFTEAEVETIEVLYETAPPGALMASVTDFLPWRYREYEMYRHVAVERQLRESDLDALERIMLSRQDGYLILTRSQKASAQLLWGWPEGQWEEIVRQLTQSENYRLVFENKDGAIFHFASENVAKAEDQR